MADFVLPNTDVKLSDMSDEEEIVNSFEKFFVTPGESKQKSIPLYSVSNWNKQFAERLNIKYATHFLPSPLEVLSKSGEINEFREMQKIYMSTVKSYLHFDAVYEKHKEIHYDVRLRSFYKGFLKFLFDDIRRLVREDLTKPKTEEDQGIGYVYTAARLNTDDFLAELAILLETVHENILDESNIPKDVYSMLFQSFANMCQLKARLGSASPSHWNNLRGYDVSSYPDYRLSQKLTCFGPSGEDRSAVVSIVETRKGHQQTDFGSLNRSRSSSTCSESLSSTNEEMAEIESELDCRVLGQHAGELLLDFMRYSFKNTMSGMIVDGTKVYFTLLEMSVTHLRKLIENEELNMDEDKATIYYSMPLDLLIEEDRNTLIENFMRLNNFQVEPAIKVEYNPR